MEKGFNSDITVRGISYHIQTEDWGYDNPFIVSRIFKGGAVLKTVKTSYSEALKTGPLQSREAIQLALKDQHGQIIDQIFSGKI